MLPIQPGIVAPLPQHARYLAYRLKPGVDPAPVLATLAKAIDGNQAVVGIGQSAHVKRTAQEDFDPEAFVWRRSMPWSDATRAGFMYVAFASDFYALEAQLRRMAGLDGGITDGLFRFSHAITCAYYWCPPMNEQGGLDLSAFGIH